MLKVYILGIFLLGLSACQTISSQQQNQYPAKTSSAHINNSATDQTILVDGHTAFAANIYQQIKEKGGNIFISPISISTAFGLAYMGSRGQTAQEISQTMQYNLPESRLHPAIGALTADLENQTSGQIFTMANALFTDKTTVLEPDYVSLTKTYYGASENSLDFKTEPELARQAINLWVKNKTHGLIAQTFKKKQITKEHRNVMVNTAYLKASWLRPFYEGATKTEVFTTPEGDVDTPMMHMTAELPYHQGKGFKLVELAYQGDTLSMIAVLPNRTNGLAKLENKISAKNLKVWLSAPKTVARRKVILTLPKLSLKDDYKLKNNLKAMGMVTPFSDYADFSGRIDPKKQPDGWPVKINNVIHKTALKLDEHGTEAAAVTAIDDVIVTGSTAKPPKPVAFKADHPFLLFIVHNETGAILFMGRINDPTQ